MLSADSGDLYQSHMTWLQRLLGLFMETFKWESALSNFRLTWPVCYFTFLFENIVIVLKPWCVFLGLFWTNDELALILVGHAEGHT